MIAREIKWDLVIAGRRGWKNEALDQAAAASGAKGRIHFCGFVDEDDQPALFSAASKFAWPSLFEGFGLPPLEAMACGTPVVSSDTSSMAETLGAAATLVDPYDVESFAEALRTDASIDTDQLRAHAAAFTWKHTVQLTLHAYEAALAP